MPPDALVTALERRSEMTPLLLAEIDAMVGRVDVIDAGHDDDRQGRARIHKALRGQHLYFTSASGQVEQDGGLIRLAKPLRFPLIRHDNLLGEPAIEEATYRVMASIFDIDARPLFDIILDRDADEAIRFSHWHTIVVLVL